MALSKVPRPSSFFHCCPFPHDAMAEELCLIPLDEKIAVLESALCCLQDIGDSLRSSRGTIDLLFVQLGDLDRQTYALLSQVRGFISDFEKEVYITLPVYHFHCSQYVQISPETPITVTAPVAPWNKEVGSIGQKRM